MGCRCSNLLNNDNQNEFKFQTNTPQKNLQINSIKDQGDDASYSHQQQFQNNELNNEPEKSNQVKKNNGTFSVSQMSIPETDFIPFSQLLDSIKDEDYSSQMLSIINFIRQNPKEYSDYIEKSTSNIIYNTDNKSKNKIVYKDKIKVALKKGSPTFLKAADLLKKMTPLPKFVLKKEICLDLPENEEELDARNFMRLQVEIINRNKELKICEFFRDNIKIPKISALLLVVDDNGEKEGEKRRVLLTEKYKYIGISSGFVGKKFVAYFTFA